MWFYSSTYSKMTLICFPTGELFLTVKTKVFPLNLAILSLDLAILSLNLAILSLDLAILSLDLAVLSLNLAILSLDLAVLSLDLAVLIKLCRNTYGVKIYSVSSTRRFPSIMATQIVRSCCNI